MANILLVAEKKSFILSSLCKLLEEKGHKIINTTYSISELSKVSEEYQTIILYTEEFTTEGLVYIKDILIEKNKPLLIVGDANEIQDIEEIIHSNFIKQKYVRPFDVNDVAKEIDNYILLNLNCMKKKILVVDDSGAVLRSVKGWLEDKYEVILANSGAMAIKYLTMNRPDLILLDYEMPICDGRQVLEMIRAEYEFSDIPVIFLTNKNDRESIMKVKELNPEGYLLKSMEPNEIVKVIDNFFEKKKWKM